MALLQVQGTNVTISIAFPPDIDTPGYAKENLQKVGRPSCELLAICHYSNTVHAAC